MYKTIISSMLAMFLASIACSQNDEASPKQSKTSLDITAGLSYNTTYLKGITKYPTYNNLSFGIYIQNQVTSKWSYGYNLYTVSYQNKFRYIESGDNPIDTSIKSKIGTSVYFAPQIMLRLNNPNSKFNIQTGLMTGVGFLFMKNLTDPNITSQLPLLGTIGLPFRATYQIGSKISLVANSTPQYIFTIHDFSKGISLYKNYKNFSIPYRVGISFSL